MAFWPTGIAKDSFMCILVDGLVLSCSAFTTFELRHKSR